MKEIFTLIMVMFFCNLFSQEKIVKKYDNGNIFYESYIVNNVLDSIYREYYSNGVIKREGVFKNCQYKTNKVILITVGCGVVKKDSIKDGILNGEWKEYYETGKIKSISNYFCGIEQGNFYYYSESENIKSIDFYNAGKKIMSQSFNDNHTLSEVEYYDEKWIKEKNYRTTRTIEFFENGNYKSETLVEEKEDGYEYENYKEYYSNGFFKIENFLIVGKKHGICYQYYENGNVKTVGAFEYDKPTCVQLFYKEDGTPLKMERWKKGKLILTEQTFDTKKSFNCDVRKYKE